MPYKLLKKLFLITAFLYGHLENGCHKFGAQERASCTTKSSMPHEPTNVSGNTSKIQLLRRESCHNFVCIGPPASPHSRNDTAPDTQALSTITSSVLKGE